VIKTNNSNCDILNKELKKLMNTSKSQEKSLHNFEKLKLVEPENFFKPKLLNQGIVSKLNTTFDNNNSLEAMVTKPSLPSSSSDTISVATSTATMSSKISIMHSSSDLITDKTSSTDIIKCISIEIRKDHNPSETNGEEDDSGKFYSKLEETQEDFSHLSQEEQAVFKHISRLVNMKYKAPLS
jgi:hypothetical protein